MGTHKYLTSEQLLHFLLFCSHQGFLDTTIEDLFRSSDYSAVFFKELV